MHPASHITPVEHINQAIVPTDAADADARRYACLFQPHSLGGMLRRFYWQYAQVARGRGERLTPLGFLHYYLAYQRTIWGLRRRWHVVPRTALEVARVLVGAKKQ